MELNQKGRENEENEKKFNEKINLLNQKIQSLDFKINDQNNLIASNFNIKNFFIFNKDLQKTNSESKNNISTLEQLLCLKEDINSQLDFAKDKVKKNKFSLIIKKE